MSEETHTQVRNAFTAALQAQGLLDAARERADICRVEPDVDDGLTLLAISDKGSQMIARDTRKFMAMLATAQHFGRPFTPTDQAWIESLNGTIKGEWPHQLAITDPAVLRAELELVRTEYNTVRLHPGVGYVTLQDEHTGRGEAIRSAQRQRPHQTRMRRLAHHRRHRDNQ
jgi:putative transposase